MPRTNNPNSSYDKDLWESLTFMAEVWNRARHHLKVRNIDFNVGIKKTIKENFEDIESSNLLALTIFTEFFFCPHDDGEHLYEYYSIYDGNLVNFFCIPKLNTDGSRTIYWPMYMDTWFTPHELTINHFPCGSEIANSSHLKTRSLLRLMLEHDLIERDWLIDYDENKYYYEITPYEGIDKNIHQIEIIPDPFKVIENNEIEKLYKAILTTCEHLMKLYETNPEMF